jgi:hypothetical protein
MTAAAALAIVPADPGLTDDAGDDGVGRLRSLVRPGFLAEVWDAGIEAFAPPRDHLLLGLRKCVVVDCEAGVRTPNTDLCKVCVEKFKTSGLALEKFAAIPCNKISKGERLCRVPGCARPSHLRVRLCHGHYIQWRLTDLSAEVFAESPGVCPLPGFGPCTVRSCSRAAAVRRGLCQPHRQRWRAALRDDPTLGLDRWRRIAEPINVDHVVILKGLSERVQLEVLLGLQERTDAGIRTLVAALRPVVEVLRRTEAASIADLDDTLIKRTRHDAALLARSLRTLVRRRLTSPAEERVNDVWDLAVFGLTGRIDFTGISQPWLRECAKRWVEDDLPRHRGRQAAATAKATVAAVGHVSASLRATRPDRGEQPDALSRRDLVNVTNRLAHQHRTGAMTELTRLRDCRSLRRFLADIRAIGLTRHGGAADGLPDDFVLSRHDIPPEPDRDQPGRDLPAWVLKVICDNLPALEERSGTDMRRMVEVLIDTGRRPDEICGLGFDCLTRDDAGKPVLVYTDSKNHRPDRRLPITEATAQLIAAQQAETRHRFPDTPISELVLFPRDSRNPRGIRPYTEQAFCNAHRRWIDGLADQLVTTAISADGQPREEFFDRLAVVPYAYRHSYAQRHADQGVPPDVLRDLLGHVSIRTTTGYYRVTEKRVRAAIDRVSAYQFDGQGRRVFVGIYGVLDHEHARIRVGQVAVPFGTCTEPTNVKAGGQACPYKFTCLGCGHFRSDPSYLPELKSYLQQLLADRERLQAATDLQDWARAQLSPRDEEITQLRDLIRRIEHNLGQLSPDDQAQIAEAVSVIRKTRQVVNLGNPTVRPRLAANQ